MDVPSRPGPGLPQTSLPKIDITSPRDPAAAIGDKANDALGSVPPGLADHPKDGFERPSDLRKAQSLFGGVSMNVERVSAGRSSEAGRSERDEGTTIDNSGITVRGESLTMGPVARHGSGGLTVGVGATNEMSNGQRETLFTGLEADRSGAFIGTRSDSKNYGRLESGIGVNGEGLAVSGATIKGTGPGAGATEIHQASLHIGSSGVEARSDRRTVEQGRTTQEKHEAAGTNGLTLDQSNHEDGETRSASIQPDGVRFRDSRGEKAQAGAKDWADKAGDAARDVLGRLNG